MKKYLLRSAIVYIFCLVAFSAAFASAQTVDNPTYLTLQAPIVINQDTSCVLFTTNLGLGSRHKDVAHLQEFLAKKGYFKFKTTGYFGILTRAAVMSFQRDNGVIATGYFGPLTRGKIKVTCEPQNPQPPQGEWYIQVISPSVGTQWQLGSTQIISWISKLPPSFAAYQYTVTLSRGYSCPAGTICSMPRPYLLVDGTIDTSVNWTVGSFISSDQSPASQPVIPPGEYTIRVCVKNGSNCAESGKITITPRSDAQALQYTVSTDKSVYKQNEKIQIALRVANTTSVPQTINFTSGCQATYTIGAYNYMAARACIMSLSSITIAPNSSHTWYLTHDPAEFQLAQGTYTLNASLLNNSGYASTNVIVVGN